MARTDAVWEEELLRNWDSRAASGAGGPGRQLHERPLAPAPVALSAADFISGVPEGYRQATSPEVAAWDLAVLSEGADRFSFWTAGGSMRARRAGWRQAELSSYLPVLEDLGLAVVEAVPWHLRLGGSKREAFVDDLHIRMAAPVGVAGSDSAPLDQRLAEAVDAYLSGIWSPGALGALVPSAGLTWPEVDLLAAVVAYRQLVGGDRSAERALGMRTALVEHPAVAAVFVQYFRARQPALSAGAASAQADRDREVEYREIEAREVEAALGTIPDLGSYEALCDVFSVLASTVRSTWPGIGGMFSLKLQSKTLPFLPEPRPWRETFVFSPAFEGVHLRFGPVARGGIRWSDRPSDLRTEVLGLARAQVKKNSLIVPTGAKGGFALRSVEAGNRGDARMSGREAYTAFMSALLDVTDAEDPYLVVAPDKGTGSFSDLANEVSSERGFWLGDAFASGGSHGYDHRALGITARGAWLSVQRHFRALGLDPDSDSLRVVGVGDMTGDVFGNAMLQSRSIHLVAAFDHRHVFIDPSPDAAASFEQRLRLSRMAGSTWADYDMSSASPGAVVLSRYARAFELGPAPARAVGLPPGTYSPDDIVRSVLRAPVDLLFFGGIGTFVKAAAEADSDVDDRANDDVRTRADELRARAVVEGANLAMTQRARIVYSRRGGRVNTDFVDNAGGVAMSDREVNLKILLGAAREAGLMAAAERDDLLAQAADEMARAVLYDVHGGIVSLDLASAETAENFAAYRSLMEDLEAQGLLNPDVESMPSVDELDRREAAGAGFARPELAVLVAFARSELARAIEGSAIASPNGVLGHLVAGYFPAAWRERFAPAIAGHPLYRQLAASRLANEIISTMGPLWAHELMAESGSTLAQVASCFWDAVRVVCPSPEVASLTDGTDGDRVDVVNPGAKTAVDWLSRWYLWSGAPMPYGPLPYASMSYGNGEGDGDRVERHSVVADELAALATAPAAGLRARAAEVDEICGSAGKAMARAPSVAEAWQVLRVAEDAMHAPALFGALSRCAGEGRWAKWEARHLQYELARACVAAAVRILVGRVAPAPTRLAALPPIGEPMSGDGAMEHLRSLATRVSAAQRTMPSVPLSLVALAVRAAGRAGLQAPVNALVDAMAATD